MRQADRRPGRILERGPLRFGNLALVIFPERVEVDLLASLPFRVRRASRVGDEEKTQTQRGRDAAKDPLRIVMVPTMEVNPRF